MRVSQHFSLELPQAALDFVDVDVSKDVRLFVDPGSLLPIGSPWAAECRSLLQHYFHTVLDAIRTGDEQLAVRLLAALREPNETHLGLSSGARARGRGLGPGLARRLYKSLSESPAIASGLLIDLQDTCLMVEGIDRDMISDITTNIIREPLIRYTQKICEFYEIDAEQVDSGPLWNPHSSLWESRFVDLPVGPSGKLLLVPKILVRQTMTYQSREYYRDYILTHLLAIHLSANSGLVRTLKTGERRVYKVDLERKYGKGKRAIAELTIVNPAVLDRYRNAKRVVPEHPLGLEALATAVGAEQPDWDDLLDAVTRLTPGGADASHYHRAVASLLQALFYPSLAFMEIEREIHSGRKRIDLVFTNEANQGFFAHVRDNYIAPFIMVECKNYSSDVTNPELDQLGGRFSNRRGWVGILCCRTFDDKELFIARCRDTANDDRGFIVALDDDDLRALVEARKTSESLAHREHPLRHRFERLVF